MNQQVEVKEKFTGICNFCEKEVDKRQMSQHLKKYCKPRMAMIKAEATAEQKVRLFHIFVEGKYNPIYWMHLEVAASESLITLDQFFRDIWVECCDHLSAFEIDSTSYSIDPPEEFMFDIYGGDDSEGGEDEESEEAAAEEEAREVAETVKDWLETLPASYLEYLPPDWVTEIRSYSTADAIAKFARSNLKALPKIPSSRVDEDMVAYWKSYYQRQMLGWLLDIFEDRSMYVSLDSVLTVGQKFSYEYDFGSTTHLALKVMAEREGQALSEDEEVKVLARNLPPFIACQVCGKRATQVAGGYYDADEHGYCDECVEKLDEDVDMLLPVVNSPRVGVCGYEGIEEDLED